MKVLRALILFWTLSWAAVAGLAAPNPGFTAGFDAANKSYAEGKFTEAASAYETLLKSGRASGAIYFNLGNAYFKAGQMGRAIAAYHAAELLTPRDPDVRANLQFARNRVQGPTLTPGVVQRWLRTLTVNEWTVIAAIGLWAWLLLLAVRQWRPGLKPLLRPCSLGLGLATGLVCVCLVAAWLNRTARTAIVVAPEAIAHQAPLEEAEPVPAFTLHDGAELRILDQKNDWFQVSTDARRVGWLKRDQLLLGSRS